MFVVTDLQCIIRPAKTISASRFIVVLDLQARDGYRLSVSKYLFVNFTSGLVSRAFALCTVWQEAISLSDNRHRRFQSRYLMMARTRETNLVLASTQHHVPINRGRRGA